MSPDCESIHLEGSSVCVRVHSLVSIRTASDTLIENRRRLEDFFDKVGVPVLSKKRSVLSSVTDDSVCVY